MNTTELGDPNKNPWYVLATIFGEQLGNINRVKLDKELAARNRRAWNGWFCGNLNEHERQLRARTVGLDPSELLPLTKSELFQIQSLFVRRMKAVGLKRTLLPAKTEDINFSKLHFRRAFDCDYFIFENKCFFSASTFKYFATFNFSVFVSYADFNLTIFKSFSDFSFSNFKNIAIFELSNFENGGHFQCVEFNDDAYFQLSTFRKIALFHSSRFYAAAIFNSTKFEADTDFRFGKFITQPPQFHSAQLYDDTIFSLPDDFRNNWPPISGTVEIEGHDNPIPVMPAAEQKRAYNRLRLFMNKNLQIDEEQYFHRMEMRCKAQTQNMLIYPLFWLYEKFSDYGNSIMRPLGGLAIVWFLGLFAKLNWVEISWVKNGWEQSGWAPKFDTTIESAGWSFANIFSFFGFQKRYFGIENLDPLLSFISATQTILGFALLFLFGLALRNRFRIR